MTETTEFSPGPWSARHNDHYWEIGSEAHGQIGDACASNHIYVDGKELPEDQCERIAEANARLSAASPELYGCLNEAINYVAAHAAITNDEPASALLSRCTAALAKARGEPS